MEFIKKPQPSMQIAKEKLIEEHNRQTTEVDRREVIEKIKKLEQQNNNSCLWMDKKTKLLYTSDEVKQITMAMKAKK